ncbi:uncharacterized protein LOC112692339 [Sipha flava]|uniref:Uncharacterized protein LOC112692339 n=2 Tax=Sipha flava TaxID=143950 RepID=A0A8B8GJK1_9HEMI|nr:uncharacterized protein LOC112692339 [Sipha flava]
MVVFRCDPFHAVPYPMESYRGAGCVDCYREHCRQQMPSIRVPSFTTTPADRRRYSSQHQHHHRRGNPTASRRLDFARHSCRLFIAGSFVIGLILVPCAMSSPIKSQYSQHQQDHGDDDGEQQQQEMLMLTDPPFWHNPCGMQITYEGSGSGTIAGSGVGHDMMMMESDSAMRREEDIIDGIVLSAKQALSQAEQFAGSFVVGTFHVDVKKFHDVWKDTTLEWLQQAEYMPKKLNVPLTKSYLDKLTFKDVLPAVYVGMQNLAVGLEQVAWDQDRERLSFAKDFKNITFQLRAILCEMSMAISEMNETEPRVSRNIMPMRLRVSRDNRSLRDWLILREYITSLQYVIEVFVHLKSRR